MLVHPQPLTLPHFKTGLLCTVRVTIVSAKCIIIKAISSK